MKASLNKKIAKINGAISPAFPLYAFIKKQKSDGSANRLYQFRHFYVFSTGCIILSLIKKYRSRKIYKLLNVLNIYTSF